MTPPIISIIFAAGRGSRLAPLTDITPKPLLEVQNKTLLEWNLEKLVPFTDKFIIVISYLGQQIIDQIGDKFQGKNVEFVWQKNPKGGTLDALRTAIFYSSKENLHGNYFITNSDDIHGPEIYNKFYESIIEDEEKALVSAKIIEDREKLKSLGVYEITKNNDLVKVWEKSQEFVSTLANSGIYYFPNKVTGLISKGLNDSQTQEHYITTNLFNPYEEKYGIKVISSTDMWLQISNIDDLENAREILKVD